MGPKNLLILFFSTVAVSLVILIIFFSMIFKNFSLDFNTRLPESAPDIGSRLNASSTMNPDSKADGILRSTVNVPPEEVRNVGADDLGSENTSEKPLNASPGEDLDSPPFTDDAILEEPYPKALPPEPGPEKTPAKPSSASGVSGKSTLTISEKANASQQQPENAGTLPAPAASDDPSASAPPTP